MEPDLKVALSEQLLAQADDELLLGHRDSQWCGHAPILEEDIAFANLALDEIGHANLWYALLSELEGQEPKTYPDWLVFKRQAGAYRNLPLVELPNGDWAFSMLRQYLFDMAELVRLKRWKSGPYPPLADISAKIFKEEIYHRRHTSAWVERLALGTDESHRRMQGALDQLWPYAQQLFAPFPHETRLVQAGIAPPAAELLAAWLEQVVPFLQSCELILPEPAGLYFDREQHTRHLKVLLDEMQSVARLDPLAQW